jgi:hypothetical protein
MSGACGPPACDAMLVGTSLSLSGRFRRQGDQARDGLQLWVEYARDAGQRPAPRLIVLDDESRASVARRPRAAPASRGPGRRARGALLQRAGARGRPHRGRCGEGALEPWRHVGRHSPGGSSASGERGESGQRLSAVAPRMGDTPLLGPPRTRSLARSKRPFIDRPSIPLPRRLPSG